ncbi:putative capsular polysaccharide synthesis family protein [Sphaerothrix gracilis]|uniref:putative capsular polysaccharide synthesis family protein n=1 Tax=Sphaerothrix gracilis TaxID=3151835 RepID=UPI0031FD0141
MINKSFLGKLQGKLKESFYLRSLQAELSTGKIAPILIYQPGKVGSSSILKSLQAHGVHGLLHVHRINPNHIERIKSAENRALVHHEKIGRLVYDQVILPKRYFKAISMVREPISRNISAFFQNFKTFTNSDMYEVNLPEINSIFLKEYPHRTILDWFDIEVFTTLGLNIYDFEFDKAEGWVQIQTENYDFLILKSEIPDIRKEKTISDFLKLENFKIQRCNVSIHKEYGNLQKRFISSVYLPKYYIDEMYNSKYTKHFYSEEEITANYRKWL